MNAPRVLVVDDEQPARQRLRELLAERDDIELMGVCNDVNEALRTLERDRPDIIFLDIRMPDMDGFQLVSRLAENERPVLVFVTAFEEYAPQAFEVDAADYLLKPFDDDRFERAVLRARERVRLRAVDELSAELVGLTRDSASPGARTEGGPAAAYVQRLSVKGTSRVVVVPVDRIDYIAARGPYADLHVEERTYLIRERMKNLERMLDPREFCRIHRSTIVRLDRIVEIQHHWRGDYVATLVDGTALKVTRSRREALKRQLGIDF